MDKYVKLIIEEGIKRIEFAPQNKGNILNFNLNIEAMLADGYKRFVEVERPETNRWYHLDYEETEDTIEEIIVYDETQEEADEREIRERREALDMMTLTPADVERALYKAKGMDFTDLKEIIAATGTGIDLKALNIEFNASLFYRGAPFGNGRLFDVVGNLLGYTPEDIDYLFENKELPVKE